MIWRCAFWRCWPKSAIGNSPIRPKYQRVVIFQNMSIYEIQYPFESEVSWGLFVFHKYFLVKLQDTSYPYEQWITYHELLYRHPHHIMNGGQWDLVWGLRERFNKCRFGSRQPWNSSRKSLRTFLCRILIFYFANDIVTIIVGNNVYICEIHQFYFRFFFELN